MIVGCCPSSKWHRTASRTWAWRLVRSSASVKMDSPKARAVYPPSGASSTRNIGSLTRYLRAYLPPSTGHSPGIDEAGLGVFPFEPRITFQDLVDGIARRQHRQSVLDGQPPAPDDRLSAEDLRIHLGPIRVYANLGKLGSPGNPPAYRGDASEGTLTSPRLLAASTLAKWGRYSVILHGKDADLILSFDISSPQEGLAHYEVPSPAGTGSMSDIATQQAPRIQETRKHWTLSVLDGDETTHPKLMEIQEVYSNDDAAAAKDLIYKLKREVGKEH